jgi:hypothetical protein
VTAVRVEERLSGEQQDLRESNLGRLEPGSVSADPEVAPTRLIGRDRDLPAEERVIDVNHRWREDGEVPAEDAEHLGRRPLGGGGRCHDLRTGRGSAGQLPRAQLVHGRFEEPDRGP